MDTLAVLERQRQFDFQKNGIETMSFETLRRTYKENDIYNKPVQGIYHYQVIQRMMDICGKYNLDYEVEEIFAAQNRNKTQPGVSILPQVEQTHGEKAVEAHILRRIFATIRIKDWETDELTTTLVVAYHQDGIQAAIGPCVRICHNQCILSPERSVCNYGRKKVTTEEVFETVDGWLANFEVNMNEDIGRIQRMKRRIVSLEEIKAALQIAFEHDNTVLIEKFIPGREFRIFIINDEVVGILHRVPANVTGDGVLNIGQLIDMKNEDPLRGKGYRTPLEKIRKGREEEMFLKQQGMDFNTVPKEGEVVYLRENSNISTGGDSIDFTDDIDDSYKAIAVEAAKALNVKITGLDMMIQDIHAPATPDNYAIIEMNFNPAIHIHCYPFKGKNRHLNHKMIRALGF